MNHALSMLSLGVTSPVGTFLLACLLILFGLLMNLLCNLSWYALTSFLSSFKEEDFEDDEVEQILE